MELKAPVFLGETEIFFSERVVSANRSIFQFGVHGVSLSHFRLAGIRLIQSGCLLCEVVWAVVPKKNFDGMLLRELRAW